MDDQQRDAPGADDVEAHLGRETIAAGLAGAAMFAAAAAPSASADTGRAPAGAEAASAAPQAEERPSKPRFKSPPLAKTKKRLLP